MCCGALEYFSFVDSLKPEGEGEEDGEKPKPALPVVCLLHASVKTLQDGEDVGCYLCVLLIANLRVKRLVIVLINELNIKMCWQVGATLLKI